MAILGGSLVGVVTGVESSRGKTVTGGRRQEELVAILVLQLVGQGVEAEAAGNGQGDGQIRRGDEGVSRRVAVVATSEVTVIGRKNRVGLALLNILTVPLSDAGTAGVRENDTTELLEGLELTVTGNGSADLGWLVLG